MIIPEDGKVCRHAWIKGPAFVNREDYVRVFVYTIYPDNAALIEIVEENNWYIVGKTAYYQADALIWECRCSSLLLFRHGCRCNDEN